MLVKNLLVSRTIICCRVQFISPNIHDFNLTLVKTANNDWTCRKDTRRSYTSNQVNSSMDNSLKGSYVRHFVPLQDFTRYKSTQTATSAEAKEESNTTKETDKKDDVALLTRAEKLKKAVKEYGSTVIVFHVAISLASLGSCYLLVTSGLDVNKLFTAIGLEDWIAKSQIASSAGTFAIAYAVHKVFAPVRIMITLTAVPLIVRHLRRIGFLKK